MARNPIRGVIERALEKGARLEDLIAVPVIFGADEQSGKERRKFIKTEGPHGIYYPLSGLEVRRVWYRENSIEVELNNGVQVSIETQPLTFAIRLKTVTDEEKSGFVQVQLIQHDEHESTAALVEDRTRSLRQVYAIACIAYGGRPYTEKLPKAELVTASDFEAYLPLEDRLLINAAGQGSFWATVGVKVVAAVKTAPKLALIALSTMFKDGPERIARVGEALVKEREGVAQESAAKGRLADAQATKAEIELQVAREATNQARTREGLITEKQRFDLQKEKMDTFFDIREKINKIEDVEQRTVLLSAFDSNLHNLLGDTAKDWLQLPPLSN
jgi:hypothetical protein